MDFKGLSSRGLTAGPRERAAHAIFDWVPAFAGMTDQGMTARSGGLHQAFEVFQGLDTGLGCFATFHFEVLAEK